MDSSRPPAKDEKSKADAMLRRMGMSLSLLGVIVFSAGLVDCRLNYGGNPAVRGVLMLVSGIAMFAAGVYIWRSAKKTD